MFKKFLSMALCILMLSSVAFAAPSSWAASEINSAKSKNLVPESLLSDYQNPITREEFCSMAVLLYEALSGKTASAGNTSFTDTKSDDVAKAYTLGIVKGVSDTLFAPKNLITRQEIAAMFLRSAQAAIPSISAEQIYVNTFRDEADIADWAKNAVKFSNLCEVMLGDENGNANPKSNTTREQAIAMVLRIYNALRKTDNSNMASYGFLSSGNTSSNMTNGAFAINALDSQLYISDNTGIYNASNKNYITKKTANAIFPDTEILYYINSADKALYSISYNGENEKKVYDSAVSFSISGEYIYINDGKNLIALTPSNGNCKTIAENVTSSPIPRVSSVVFATLDGIYLYDMTKSEKTLIYNGKAEKLAMQGNYLYFINEDNKLCTIAISGEKYTVISNRTATSFCVYQNAIAYTADDGIYKCAKDGKFNIKITDDTNCKVNSFDKTLYIKTSEGKISTLNPLTAEKSALN